MSWAALLQPPLSTPLLEAHDLACVRGDRRLFRRLEFTLQPGRWLRVRGANGSGKTSLLRLLAGLSPPDRGQVLWRGQPVLREREAYARELLYLGHLPALKGELSPLQNLCVAARLAGVGADDGAAVQALADGGLERQMHLPCKLLSAGQQRRAALARLALARPQTLWLLDEPFNALDAQAVAQLCGVIDGHVQRGGMVVLTTHQEVPLPDARGAQLQVDAWAA